MSPQHVQCEGQWYVVKWTQRSRTQLLGGTGERLMRRLLQLLGPLVWLNAHCPYLTHRRDKQRVVRFAKVVNRVLSAPAMRSHA